MLGFCSAVKGNSAYLHIPLGYSESETAEYLTCVKVTLSHGSYPTTGNVWIKDEKPDARIHAIRSVAETTQQLAGRLKELGFPVSAIAETVRVERKTVYSWIDGGIDANEENHERLRQVHALLAGEPKGSLRFFHRLWNRKLVEGESLRDVLTAKDFDVEKVEQAIKNLKPAVERSMMAAEEDKINGHDEAGMADNLTTYLTVEF